MNLFATRSAAVAAALAFAQACSSSSQLNSAQERQNPELAQGELTKDREVGAVEEDLVDLKAPPTFGYRANSTEPNRAIRMNLQKNCPMFGDDVEVEASLTSTGTTLRFTTESGDVADLRRRVRHTGEVYGSYGGEMEMGWFQVRDPAKAVDEIARSRRVEQVGASPSESMPIVNVAVVDLDTGAQIFFTPTEPEDRAAVRVHTAVHRQHLAAGQCWMPKDSLMPYAPATPVQGVGSQGMPKPFPSSHAFTPPEVMEGA